MLKNILLFYPLGAPESTVASVEFCCWIRGLFSLYNLIFVYIFHHMLYFFNNGFILYNYILIPNQTYTKILPSFTVSPWPNQQHMILMFTSPATPRQVHVTNALKIILKNWNRCGMTCMHLAMASGGLIS
jgi:hypothetical protein